MFVKCLAKCLFFTFAECPEPILNPPYQPNTIVSNREHHGDSGLTYSSISTCGEGFILIGSSKRRCKTDGNWTGEKPVCHGMYRHQVVYNSCILCNLQRS